MICKDNDFSLTEMKLITANSYPMTILQLSKKQISIIDIQDIEKLI